MFPIENIAYILLPVLLVTNLVLVIRDKRQYARFKALTSTAQRQKMLRRWVFEAGLFYGLVALICLVWIGQLDSLISAPPPVAQVAERLHSFLVANVHGFFAGIMISIIPALLIGPTVVTLISTYSGFKNKGVNAGENKTDGRDINALLPRNRAEIVWTSLLSINAGITEELFFRLLAPVLFFAVTGSAFWAILLSTLWFGLAHYYQGWIGIIVTTIIGALFMALYIYTGNIWLVMLIHAVLNLNQMCFAPWFTLWLQKKQA